MSKLLCASVMLASLSILFVAGCQKQRPLAKPNADNSTDSPVAELRGNEVAATVATGDGMSSPAPSTVQPQLERDSSTSEPSAVPQTDTVAVDTDTSANAPTLMAAPSAAANTVPETWTSQRLVILGNGAPRFFKIDVNIGHRKCEDAFQSAIAKLAGECSIDFAKPPEWDWLLDQPLIATGWLGNLVPSAEQREQLRALYDTNKNKVVDETEFSAFLTRGLSRVRHLKLSARSAQDIPLSSNSMWGPVDQDESGDLSALERSQAAQTMLRYDFDGDRILTLAEFRSAADTDMNGPPKPPPGSLLDKNQVLAWELDKPEHVAQSIVDAYSFNEELTSDVLYAWSRDRMHRFDANDDSIVSPMELKAINDRDLDAQFQVSLPDLTSKADEKVSVNFTALELSDNQRWLSHADGGRLTLDGCIVTIVLNDEQSASTKEAFKQQFERLKGNAQLKTLVMQALELKEGAFETLESFAERKQEDSEELAWQWLVQPRHWHIQLGWSVSDYPWFELMDLNGDRRLVTAELDAFASYANGWDRNRDGMIAAEEMPISVLLEVRRAESRSLRSRLGGTAVEKRGANVASAPTWFTGMDYNSDGELTHNEFLGESSDFEKLDLNRDGIIEAREVSTPQ